LFKGFEDAFIESFQLQEYHQSLQNQI